MGGKVGDGRGGGRRRGELATKCECVCVCIYSRAKNGGGITDITPKERKEEKGNKLWKKKGRKKEKEAGIKNDTTKRVEGEKKDWKRKRGDGVKWREGESVHLS